MRRSRRGRSVAVLIASSSGWRPPPPERSSPRHRPPDRPMRPDVAPHAQRRRVEQHRQQPDHALAIGLRQRRLDRIDQPTDQAQTAGHAELSWLSRCRAGHGRAGKIVERVNVVRVGEHASLQLVERLRERRLMHPGPLERVWVERGHEVLLAAEVAVHGRDGHPRLACHGRHRDRGDATSHDAPGRVEDARPRLVGLLRTKLAAVLSGRRIGNTSHIVNIGVVSRG